MPLYSSEDTCSPTPLNLVMDRLSCPLKPVHSHGDGFVIVFISLITIATERYRPIRQNNGRHLFRYIAHAAHVERNVVGEEA